MPAGWFDLLPTELQGLSDEELIEPNGEIEASDNVVASIADDVELQKLWTLGRRLRVEARRILVEAQIAGRNDQQEMLTRANELDQKGELVLDIFWASIKDSFGLWDKSSVGIREGWQVVWNDADSTLPPFLRGLFG